MLNLCHSMERKTKTMRKDRTVYTLTTNWGWKQDGNQTEMKVIKTITVVRHKSQLTIKVKQGV